MGGRFSYGTRPVILLAAACAVAFAGLGEARTAPKPNLRVSSLSTAAAKVAAGGTLGATDTTLNSGKGKAGKSSTAYYLSADAKKDARDRRVGARAVPALKARKKSKKAVTLTIPRDQAERTYRLIACADVARKVRESKESDNCRVAPTALSVTAPAIVPAPTNPNPVVDPPPLTDPPTTPDPPKTDPPTTDPPAATTSEQIQALRDAPDGVASLPVAGAVVTYLKPALGSDAAGFFIQAVQAGPAVFVGVDPAGVSPVPAVGDRVSFTATGLATTGTLRMVSALSGFTRTATGVDVSALEQAVSASSDLVSAVGSYESELVSFTGTVAGAFTGAGSGHVAAPINTTGIIGDGNLRLRIPTTVRDALFLEQGCTFTLDAGPMWRFNAVAQPSAYSASDVSSVTCPAPTVVSAVAPSSTSVVVTFSKEINPTSVASDGSQFTADAGLTFSAASVTGNTVTLTSSAQTANLGYTVTVANTVQDMLGAGVGNPNSAGFSGFVQPAVLQLNEIGPNIGSSHDLIELKAVSGGSVAGITVSQGVSTVNNFVTMPSLTVATGDLIVVHLTPTGTTGIAPGSETTSKNEFSSGGFPANYDNAWDVLGEAQGITYTNRVIRVRDSLGNLQDAVPFGLTGQTISTFPGDVQAIQASGDWLPADCGGAPCNYLSTPTVMDISVLWDGAGTTPAGNSISRKPIADSDQKSDWYAAAAQTFGADNP